MDAAIPTVFVFVPILLLLAVGLFSLIKLVNVGFMPWLVLMAVAALGFLAVVGSPQVTRRHDGPALGNAGPPRIELERDFPRPLFLREDVSAEEAEVVFVSDTTEFDPVAEAFGEDVVAADIKTADTETDDSETEDSETEDSETEDVVQTSLPAWVNAAPRLDQNGHLVLTIHSGPHARIVDCEAALSRELRGVAGDYIEKYVEHGEGRDVRNFIQPQVLSELVVTDEHVETKKHSFGAVNYDIGDTQDKMIQVHQRLRFGPEAHEALWRWAREAVVEQRLWKSVFSVGAVLTLLATVFGCLSIDQATAGKYRGRIGLGATAVVGLIGGGAYFFMA